MCEELCEGDNLSGCQNCGCLICFDVERGDDILRPAYVTASGDLFCNHCGAEEDRRDEEEADNEFYYDYGI